MPHSLFQFSPRITAIPVIHGSGDFAVEVRRIMLADKYDCLAVPLPPSFKPDTERAIESRPLVTLVTQRESTDFNPDADEVAPSPPFAMAPRVRPADLAGAFRGGSRVRLLRH